MQNIEYGIMHLASWRFEERREGRGVGTKGEERGSDQQQLAASLHACTPTHLHTHAKNAQAKTNQRSRRRQSIDYGKSGIKQPGFWKRRRR